MKMMRNQFFDNVIFYSARGSWLMAIYCKSIFSEGYNVMHFDQRYALA
jgi:hypothetical protein